jgi:uncharacterized membrane protein
MIRLVISCIILWTTASAAQAELSLCNRTSYQMEAAIALEKRANVSTRGWFRIDPGQCKQVVEGAVDVDMVYINARTPPVYGSAPLPQNGNADFCVRDGNFQIDNARSCPASQQARFSPARPSDTPKGYAVNLAEEADYDDAQARLAGIQRLLVIAGYDANPIDGVQGFTWCNDTKYAVMAAIGTYEAGATVARGWYRVDAGQCLRPDVRGDPRKVLSYGEAIDSNGRVIRTGDAPLSWGGTVALCTRDGKFELSDHKDCAARGLNSAGFAAVDIGTQGATIVRFKE